MPRELVSADVVAAPTKHLAVCYLEQDREIFENDGDAPE
jgi:hypothetical protein